MQEPNQNNVRPPLPAVNGVVIEGEFTQEELLMLGQMAPEAESPEVAVVFHESKESAATEAAIRAASEQAELDFVLEMSKQEEPAAVAKVAEENKHGDENDKLAAILRESELMAAAHKKALEEREEKELQDAIVASKPVAVIFSKQPEAKPAVVAEKPVVEKKNESEAARAARIARAAAMEKRTADAKAAKDAQDAARQAAAYQNADRTPGSVVSKKVVKK